MKQQGEGRRVMQTKAKRKKKQKGNDSFGKVLSISPHFQAKKDKKPDNKEEEKNQGVRAYVLKKTDFQKTFSSRRGKQKTNNFQNQTFYSGSEKKQVA